MKKIIIILMCLTMLCGCSDYAEINDMVIVSGIIIDYKDNMFTINTETIVNDKESRIETYETTSPSIQEGLSKISEMSNKKLFLPHLKSLILTKDAIKSNVNYYEYFLRDPKSKMNFNIYVIDSSIKDELFKINDKDGVSMYLEKMIDFNKKVFSSSHSLTFLELMYKRYERGIDQIYPEIDIKENDDKKTIYLKDLLVFDDENNEVILEQNESIYYNLISNTLDKTTLEIDCDKDKFYITINDYKTKYKWKDNKFQINIKLDTKINTYNCKYDLNKKESVNKLNNLIDKEIKNNIMNLINIEKDKKVDFIGIGNYIYKHDKKYFNFKKNNWNNNLKNIVVKVNSKSTISSIGEMRK